MMVQLRTVIGLCLLMWFGHDGISQEPRPVNADELRLNQMQVIGTHNSYHLAPVPGLMKLISGTNRSVADSIDYTHLPLTEQLNTLGMRQLELDIYADPEGGRFAKPVGRALLGKDHRDERITYDFDEVMNKPGMKIIHAPGFDYASSVPTLIAALEEIRAWSKSKPNHVPVLILIEAKDSVSGPAGVTALPFDAATLDAVDVEIRSVFSPEEIITPDSVRGDQICLRDAIINRGWPMLSECRGKVIFALDNESDVRDRYLDGHPSLEGRVMFVSVDESNPAAAFMKLNGPMEQFDRIQAMAKKGFLIRTRADADTAQARSNDTARREKAFASGAQYISTDYPKPDLRLSEYQVGFPIKAIARPNPVTHSNQTASDSIQELEPNQ